MTTPISNTPISIIGDAMRDAGLLQQGDEPDSDQIAVNLRRLLDIIRLWQTRGIKLWLNRETVLAAPTFAAGTSLYTFGPAGTTVMAKPQKVISASYYDNATYPSGRPLSVLSWDQYTMLGQRTQPGPIIAVFEDRQATTLNLTLWQVPDAQAITGTIKFLFRQQVTGPISLTETMDFPEEWRIALRWGLADELCTGQPQAIMDRCAARATLYRTFLEEADEDSSSVSFSPEYQGAGASSFR